MLFRTAAPATVAGLMLVASIAPVQAQEAQDPPGLARTAGELTLLAVDAGSLLSVDVLSDALVANTHEAFGARSAIAAIDALAIESPALGVSETVPVVAVESTGGASDESSELSLVDNPVLSGSLLPVTLSAVVDDLGATSELGAGLLDLDLLGGVLGVAGTQVYLGGKAVGDNGAAQRGIDVDALTVLDLEALLAGLGIDLADLPLETILGLVDSLGLTDDLGATLAGLGVPVDPAALSPESIAAAIGSVSATVDTLVATADGLTDATTETCTQVVTPVIGLLGDVIGTDVTTVCADVETTVDQTLADIAAAVTDLTDQLAAALTAPLDLLAGTTLLSLDGLDVSVFTTATESVETSVAEVTGTLGALTIGELGLAPIDLLATADQLNAVLDTAEAAVGGVLGQVDPSLADLVAIDTMTQSTSVTEDADGLVTATAEFTGLRVEVLPVLDDLLALLQRLADVNSVGDQLAALGAPVPAGAAEMLNLNTLLAGVPTAGLLEDGAVFALTEGLTIEVASLSQTSAFVPVAAAAAAPDSPAITALPTTGGDHQTLLAIGGLAIVAALVARRRFGATAI